MIINYILILIILHTTFLKYLMIPSSQNNLPFNGLWNKINANFFVPNMFPRNGHTTIFAKSSLFIFGGYPGQEIADQLKQQDKDLYFKSVIKFNLSLKEATANQLVQAHTNSFIQSFAGIHYHSAAVLGNQMYIFGGCNGYTQAYRLPEIWSMNIETFSVKKHETKGSPPRKRNKPLMTMVGKTYILVYGGQFKDQLLCDFHLFKLETKNWFTPTDLHQFELPALRFPSITCLNGETLYLFGGEQEFADNTIQMGTKFMKTNNFYQIKIIQKNTSVKPDLKIKKVHCTESPPPCSNHKIMSLQEKFILLMGGSEEEKTQVWVYVPTQITWVKINTMNEYSIDGAKMEYFCSGDRIIVYGGSKSETNNLILNLQIKSFEAQMLNKAKNKAENPKICLECHENKIKLFPIPQKLLASKLSEYVERISFPFQAIALLVDNSLLAGAESCSLTFGQWKTSSKTSNKDKYILISDVGQSQNIWGLKVDNFMKQIRQFVGNTLDKDMAEYNFQQNKEKSMREIEEKRKKIKKEWEEKNSNRSSQMTQAPKKTEKDFQKQREQLEEKQNKLEKKQLYVQMERNRKIYTTNLKVGGLRLGDVILYESKEKVMKSENVEKEYRRVFLIQKINGDDDQEYYGFYAYVTENNTLISSEMDSASKYINEQYKKERKLFPNEKGNFNAVYISGLRETRGDSSNISELDFREEKNDVYWGSKELIQKYEKSKVDFSESCDVSLKAFLSVLFLKNQMRMTMNVKSQPEQSIECQPFLPDINQIERDKDLIQLDDCFDFECCNIVELYMNPFARDTSRKPYLHNGVLMYQKNRLITRFKYPLGYLLEEIDIEEEPIHNLPEMFGFLEVVENINVNDFKTGFVCESVLSKSFSRLKFVSEYKKNRTRKSSQSQQ